MGDDAKAIEQVHADTFTQGTIRAREHDGSYEYCVSTGREEYLNAGEKGQSSENKQSTQDPPNLEKAEVQKGQEKVQKKVDFLLGKSSTVDAPSLGKEEAKSAEVKAQKKEKKEKENGKEESKSADVKAQKKRRRRRGRIRRR